jgi:hypothetical protein
MRVIGILLAISALPACATITRGSNEVVIVETDPSGAQVKLSNGMACDATPCSFKVPRRGDLVVSISKDGYESSQHNLTTQVGGGGGAAMAGNVLVGGFIGAGVDAASGAMLEHKPNPLKVQLNKIAPVASDPAPASAPVGASVPTAEPAPAAGAPGS